MEPTYKPRPELVAQLRRLAATHRDDDLIRLLLALVYLTPAQQEQLWANVYILYSLIDEKETAALKKPLTEIIISIEKKHKRMVNADA